MPMLTMEEVRKMESLPDDISVVAMQEIVALQRRRSECVAEEDFRGAHKAHKDILLVRKNAVEQAARQPALTPARLATPVSPGSAGTPLGGAPRSRSSRAILASKVVLLGDRGAGKSSIFSHFIYGRWDHPLDGGNPRLHMKTFVTRQSGVQTTIVLWDSPGVTTLRALPPLYYKDADAIAVVFDASAGAEGGRRARALMRLVRQECADTPLALLANKCDTDSEARRMWQPIGIEAQRSWLDDFPNLVRPITNEAQRHIDEVNCTDLCFPVSAKEGAGVMEAISALVEVTLQREKVLGYQVKPGVSEVVR